MTKLLTNPEKNVGWTAVFHYPIRRDLALLRRVSQCLNEQNENMISAFFLWLSKVRFYILESLILEIGSLGDKKVSYEKKYEKRLSSIKYFFDELLRFRDLNLDMPRLSDERVLEDRFQAMEHRISILVASIEAVLDALDDLALFSSCEKDNYNLCPVTSLVKSLDAKSSRFILYLIDVPDSDVETCSKRKQLLESIPLAYRIGHRPAFRDFRRSQRQMELLIKLDEFISFER